MGTSKHDLQEACEAAHGVEITAHQVLPKAGERSWYGNARFIECFALALSYNGFHTLENISNFFSLD